MHQNTTGYLRSLQVTNSVQRLLLKKKNVVLKPCTLNTKCKHFMIYAKVENIKNMAVGEDITWVHALLGDILIT